MTHKQISIRNKSIEEAAWTKVSWYRLISKSGRLQSRKMHMTKSWLTAVGCHKRWDRPTGLKQSDMLANAVKITQNVSTLKFLHSKLSVPLCCSCYVYFWRKIPLFPVQEIVKSAMVSIIKISSYSVHMSVKFYRTKVWCDDDEWFKHYKHFQRLIISHRNGELCRKNVFRLKRLFITLNFDAMLLLFQALNYHSLKSGRW